MSHLSTFKTILELKRYSKNTIAIYLSAVKSITDFLNIDSSKLRDLHDKDIILTIINITKSKQYAASSQKQLIGAIALYYKELYKRDIDFSVIYPVNKEEFLPTILSKTEVKNILKNTTNIKHKAVLATIYGLGLRISELINIKIIDIDSNRMLVHIHNAKGKKDRMVMLPENLLITLRAYFKIYKPKTYLFEGRDGKVYSASSIRKIFKNALVSTKINKPATIHTLRHSFATHLLENGTDIRIIQKLLGHKNIKTTLQYTQVAESTIQNVKSPLDTL
ncbi:tyrosine-type recombinase/integrase [Winogradskyella pulchriflava]|uniref:Tyrosine-type recombinase/integrase n=1 Tax=Winogradskyella pulchriflava TaxID=1110688 RepID=A0ABV6QBC1_9FLAO